MGLSEGGKRAHTRVLKRGKFVLEAELGVVQRFNVADRRTEDVVNLCGVICHKSVPHDEMASPPCPPAFLSGITGEEGRDDVSEIGLECKAASMPN